MAELTTSRRTLVKGAAWAVPVVTVAAAAPALAASSDCVSTYQDVTKTFIFYDSLGHRVTIAVTASNIPMTVPPGATLLPVATTATVTSPAVSYTLMLPVSLGSPTPIDGTLSYTLTLSGALDEVQSTALPFTRTPYYVGTDFPIQATGTSAIGSVPAGTRPGQVVITMGEPTAHLIGYLNGFGAGTTTIPLATIPNRDYTLATFTICG